MEQGESRDALLLALAPALGVLGLSLLILVALHLTEPQEFAPLPTTGEEMRRYADAGYFPLMAAARDAERHTLATAARLQTFGSFAIILLSAAYSARRGFLSARVRGWSNAFWVSSVIALSLAPSVFHGLTPQTLDYLVTSSAGREGVGFPGFLSEIYGAEGLNSRMPPAVFLIERGVLAAALASFFAVLAHDLGYRLREALEDFGLIEEDEDRRRRASAGAGQGARAQSRRGSSRSEAAGEGGFGHRQAPPSGVGATGEDARARAVLGVGVDASKREIERAYRSQMKRAHPDRGGSVERAAALNAARDLLLGRR